LGQSEKSRGQGVCQHYLCAKKAGGEKGGQDESTGGLYSAYRPTLVRPRVTRGVEEWEKGKKVNRCTFSFPVKTKKKKGGRKTRQRGITNSGILLRRRAKTKRDKTKKRERRKTQKALGQPGTHRARKPQGKKVGQRGLRLPTPDRSVLVRQWEP